MGSSKTEHRETDLLAWLARQPETGGLLGDDAARLPEPAPRTITVDSQIEGVHFPVGDALPPEALARRLLAVNVSDLAAAGARPSHAFLALAAPPGFAHRRFFTAFLSACRASRIVLAGGDLASHPERVVATMTLLGDPPPGGAPLHREDAATGHGIWVGATLGESGLGRRLLEAGATVREGDGRLEVSALPSALDGSEESLRRAARRAVLRHLEPAPQLDLGLALGALPSDQRGAVMDVSDGLALDLRRLCDRSGVSAVVRHEDLPRPPAFEPLCSALGADPTRLLLGGGEDYVLLFTLPADAVPPAAAARIGRVEAGTGPPVLERDGVRQPWPDLGWDHLAEG